MDFRIFQNFLVNLPFYFGQKSVHLFSQTFFPCGLEWGQKKCLLSECDFESIRYQLYLTTPISGFCFKIIISYPSLAQPGSDFFPALIFSSPSGFPWDSTYVIILTKREVVIFTGEEKLNFNFLNEWIGQAQWGYSLDVEDFYQSRNFPPLYP